MTTRRRPRYFFPCEWDPERNGEARADRPDHAEAVFFLERHDGDRFPAAVCAFCAHAALTARGVGATFSLAPAYPPEELFEMSTEEIDAAIRVSEVKGRNLTLWTPVEPSQTPPGERRRGVALVFRPEALAPSVRHQATRSRLLSKALQRDEWKAADRRSSSRSRGVLSAPAEA